MMNTTLAVAEVSSASETYEASARSTTSCGRTRAEKGQSFADSPALVKVKAEENSDRKAQPDNGDSGKSDSDDANTTPSSPQETVVQQKSPEAAHSQTRKRGSKVTSQDSQPKSQALTVESAAALGVDQTQQTQPVAQDGAVQDAKTQPIVDAQGEAAQTQVCQTPVTTPVTGSSTPVVDSGVIQAGQPPVARGPAEIPTAAKDAQDTTDTQGSTRACDATPPTVKIAGAEVAAESTDVGAASNTVPQKPAPTETPALSPSDKVLDGTQTITKGQQPVQGSKSVAPIQTNPPMETQAGLGQNQEDSPHKSVQAESGNTRPASVESIANVLSTGKDDLQVVQKGQDTQTELSTVSLDMSTTGASRVPTQTSATLGSETATLKNPAQDLTDQVGSALRAGLDRPDKQLTVRLQPPELGSVVVRFEEQGQQIKAVLEVSRPETGKEIEQALPQVVKNLQEAGLQIRKFDVVVSDSLGKDAGHGSSSQSHDPWNQQQAWSGAGNRSDGASRPAWSSWNSQAQNQSDSSRVHTPQNVGSPSGIDLLV